MAENLLKQQKDISSHRCSKFYKHHKIEKNPKAKKHIWTHYNTTTKNQRLKNLKEQPIKKRHFL